MAEEGEAQMLYIAAAVLDDMADAECELRLRNASLELEVARLKGLLLDAQADGRLLDALARAGWPARIVTHGVPQDPIELRRTAARAFSTDDMRRQGT